MTKTTSRTRAAAGTETKTAAAKPAEPKKAVAKTAVAKAAVADKAAAKTASPKAAAGKNSPSKAATSKPTASKPTASKPAETKLAATKSPAPTPVASKAPAKPKARKTTALGSATAKVAAAQDKAKAATEAAESAAPPIAETPKPTAAPPAAAHRAPEPASLRQAEADLEDDISALRDETFSAVGIPKLPTPDGVIKPYARMMESGAGGARSAYAHATENNEALAKACFESANAASRGLVALNGQVLDLMRANTDLTLSLMRATLGASSVSEAVKLQTSGARQAFETTSAHMKAIAEATTKLVGDTAAPISDAIKKR